MRLIRLSSDRRTAQVGAHHQKRITGVSSHIPDLTHSPATPSSNVSVPSTPHEASIGRDPMSLFVGGLDAQFWDEGRLAALFGRYGGLESIKLLKPGNHLSKVRCQQHTNKVCSKLTIKRRSPS
jgi:hypothetical protein